MTAMIIFTLLFRFLLHYYFYSIFLLASNPDPISQERYGLEKRTWKPAENLKEAVAVF